jgi:hypothetical protein
MDKLCIIMQHITLCTPCIAFMLVSHICIFAIDHAEQGRVEPPEPASVEIGDYEQDQGKPRCIPPKSLSFIFDIFYNTICLCIKFIGIGWHRRYIKIFLLDYPCYHCCNSCRPSEMARHRQVSVNAEWSKDHVSAIGA